MTEASQVHVKVSNGNDFDIGDRFDGIPYTFKARTTVPIPLEAAIHFFGFQVDPESQQLSFVPDSAHVCRRWGWNTPEFLKNDRGRKMAERITVTPVTYELREKPEDEDVTDLPAPRVSAPKAGEKAKATERA